jgi:hypothetical protein
VRTHSPIRICEVVLNEEGCVATFGVAGAAQPLWTPTCAPSNLTLPDHVDRFLALNRSPSRLEFSEALLGIHSTLDDSMILFENVVQLLPAGDDLLRQSADYLLFIRFLRAAQRAFIKADSFLRAAGLICGRLPAFFVAGFRVAAGLDPRFRSAHRAFIAADIRRRATAVIVRFR